MEDDWALGIDLFLHNLILTTEARRHGEKPESRSREKTFAIPRRFLLIYSLYICYSKELTGERSVAFPQRETVAFCVLGKFATPCRPDSQNQKTRLKLSQIGLLKNIKKWLRQPFDRPVELHFGLCFQQSAMGVGVVAERRRQRAARVGFADLDRSTPGSRRSLTMTICGAAILRRAAYGIAGIARDRKTKIYH